MGKVDLQNHTTTHIKVDAEGNEQVTYHGCMFEVVENEPIHLGNSIKNDYDLVVRGVDENGTIRQERLKIGESTKYKYVRMLPPEGMEGR